MNFYQYLYRSTHTKIIAIFVIYAHASTLNAQDKDDIETQVIQVSKSFTPKVTLSRRITLSPHTDTIQEKKLKLSYKNLDAILGYDFELPPLKEKNRKVIGLNSQYHNFVSAGLGLYAAPDILACFILPTKIGEFGSFVKYNSSLGDLNINPTNNYIDALGNIYFKNNISNFDIKTQLDYTFKKYNYYGFPEEDLPNDTEDVFQKNQNFKIGIQYNNLSNSNTLKLIGGKVNFSSFTDNFSNSVQQFYLSNEFLVPIENEIFKFNLIYKNYIQNNNLIKPQDTAFYDKQNTVNAINLQSSFQVYRDFMAFKLGFDTYFRSEKENSVFLFFPNIQSSISLIDKLLSLEAKISGGIDEMNLQRKYEVSPFIQPFVRPFYTKRLIQIDMGLKGLLTQNMSYFLNSKITRKNNMPIHRVVRQFEDKNSANLDIYQNTNSSVLLKDSVWILEFSGELSYNTSQTETGVILQLNKYSLNKFDKAYGYNQFEAQIFNTITLNDSWKIFTQLLIEHNRYAAFIDENNTFTDIVLPSIYDLHFEVWYSFSDRLSVFMKGYNLLNQKIDIIPNTNSIGIQAYAGITFQF